MQETRLDRCYKIRNQEKVVYFILSTLTDTKDQFILSRVCTSDC